MRGCSRKSALLLCLERDRKLEVGEGLEKGVYSDWWSSETDPVSDGVSL